MDERAAENAEAARAEKIEQPALLKDFLRAINAARRQSSLYGSDHQNTRKTIEELIPVIEDFVKDFGPSTFIFTRDAVLVNDRCYKSSTDSRDMYQRLRVRGTVAITFLQDIPSEQAAGFLAFLNTEPREIVQQGGPSAYLRKHSVTRIVATEAIYGAHEGSDVECESPDQPAMDSDPVDRAVLAAIEWLTKQEDKDKEKAPKLPINEILSDPTKTAKLVREAVTKLHTSRRSEFSAEMATQTINDMKDLASKDTEKWDQATPQIRKAILKLPQEMRPAAIDFMVEDESSQTPDEAAFRREIDVSEAEAMVAEVFEGSVEAGSSKGVSALHDLESLFGVKTSGLLSSWQRELQPVGFVKSSGRTFATLMTWETSPAEHGRIAHALASLVSRALEMKDSELALELAGALVEEANRQEDLRWRSANARSALQSLDLQMLKGMVEDAMNNSDLRSQEVAASLVEILPSLALSMVDLLGEAGSASFNDSLKRGVVRSGRVAAPLLGRLLSEGSSSAKESALEVLVDMRSESAITEIEAALKQADPALLISALDMLAKVPSSSVARICVGCLRHRSPDVRCASLRTLGKLGDESALPYLIRFATRRGFRIRVDEQIAAIESLGQSGPPEVAGLLEQIACRRPLIRRSQYELVQAAARRAIVEIASRNESCELKVA